MIRLFVTLSLLIGLSVSAVQAAELQALHMEVADRWTHQVGLAKSLEQAGFATKSWDRNPSALTRKTDLFVIGSFASESPNCRKWLEQHAQQLGQFLRSGGVLLQLTQADQTEALPAFLPEGLCVRRTDKDGEPVRVLDDQHPLVAALPRRPAASNQLLLPFHHRSGSWESLHQPRGFKVLLTLDETHRNPVLVEAAVGKGRLVLTSLFFDKIVAPTGELAAPNQFRQASTAFFQGLHDYVAAVKQGTAPSVEPTLPYVPPAPAEFVPGSATIVALPDTQIYSERYPKHFVAQTEWIKANREKHQIVAVFHEGDITNHNTPEQWQNARAAMSVIFGELPVIAAPGNHDMGPGGNGATHESLMSNSLTIDDFRKHDSFQGTMEPGRTENNYSLFEVHDQPWIGIALEWAPRDKAVAWANRLLQQHRDRLAVIVTHAYMYYDETKYDWSLRQDQSWSPYRYGVKESPEGINDGGDLWRKLVNEHPNVAMVLSGHVLNDGAGRLSETTRFGNVVHQMLANYQMLAEGGMGWLRLIELLPDGKTIQVKTYSPVLDQFNTDPQHQFKLTMKVAEPPK